MISSEALSEFLAGKRQLVDRALDRQLPPVDTPPTSLHEAMRYAVLAGGKRLRPILMLEVNRICGGKPESILLPALAIEILHTYTLVHDDLPCMDDDDLRRGQPTVHRKWDDAHAVLVGDALLTLAFEWMAHCPAPEPHLSGRLSLELAIAAGSQGVISGQVDDLATDQAKPDEAMLERIHRNKTAALIRACFRIGAIAAGAEEERVEQLGEAGEAMGLAFQITDDILDATASTEILGKPAGSDADNQKITSIDVLGLAGAQARAKQWVDQALDCLSPESEDADTLRALTRHMIERLS